MSEGRAPMLADHRPTRSWLRLVVLPITAATIIGGVIGGLLGWIEYACDEEALR